MKTMCPPGYPHNGYLASHALEHIITDCWYQLQFFGPLVATIGNYTSFSHVHELPKSHCSDNWEGILLHDFI